MCIHWTNQIVLFTMTRFTLESEALKLSLGNFQRYISPYFVTQVTSVITGFGDFRSCLGKQTFTLTRRFVVIIFLRNESYCFILRQKKKFHQQLPLCNVKISFSSTFYANFTFFIHVFLFILKLGVFPSFLATA